MGLRGALLRRWSRQDWLAVLVVGLAVAFLTGVGLVVFATSAETAALASEFDSPASVESYGSPAAAERAAQPGDVVLPVATATVDGTRVTVVGVPNAARGFEQRTGVALPDPPPDGQALRGATDESREARLAGVDGDVTVTVSPAERSALPPGWYVVSPATVDRLGATEALLLSRDASAGTPMVGAPAFLLGGARSLLRTLGVAAVGAGVFVGVTVFGVTRVVVRDRRRTVRVLRATGGTRRAVLGLFALRAGSLAAVGVALGFAVGVVLTNVAVSVAVFLGRPVTLSPRLTAGFAAPLLASYLGIVATGAVGGVLAALPVVRRPPGRVARAEEVTKGSGVATGSGVPTGSERPKATPRFRGMLAALRPSLLDWRAFVPTAATLSAFLVFAVIAASTFAVVAPLATADGPTIAEPGTTSPLDSSVPEAYADQIRAKGIAASPELIVPAVDDGRSYVVRGADFEAFATVSDAELVAGRPPTDPGEAVVGRDLARRFDLSVGDRLTVGGATMPAVGRVKVVGVYDGPPPLADQVVIPLETARHLAGLPDGSVQFVRLAEQPAADGRVEIVDVEHPASVPAGGTVTVTVLLANPTAEQRTRDLTLGFGEQRERRSVALEPGERRSVQVSFQAGQPGERTVTVGNASGTVDVVRQDELRILGLPEEVPPGSELNVRVVTAAGEPARNATVTVDGTTRQVRWAGNVRLPFEEPGTATVTVKAGNRTLRESVTVAEGAAREFEATLSVEPARPTVATEPTARVVVQNPWNRTITRDVVIRSGSETVERTVTLAPGKQTAVETTLPRRPPGKYQVSVDGGAQASGTYRVDGDPRLAATLADGGGNTAGLAGAIEVVFGNLELLLGTVTVLAGLATVGSTLATFAGAVHARRRTIGIRRATGASRASVFRVVLADALVIGLAATVAATLLAVVALLALDAAGWLSPFGVGLLSAASPLVILGAAIAGLVLALSGAALATLGVLATPPAKLLADGLTGRVGPGRAAGPVDSDGGIDGD